MDTSVIGTLSTCFWVCLSFTVLFFIISVILFFVFDIKMIFNIRTGRAQTKTIKEMKSATESTGRLRIDGKTQTSKLTEEEKVASRAPAVAPPQSDVQNQHYSSGSEETEILSQDKAESNGYENMVFAETTVLSGNMTNDLEKSDLSEPVKINDFRVVKRLVYIHTDEVI